MKPTPNDWALGLTILGIAPLIIRRDIVDWCREARAWLQLRKVSR